MDEPPEDTQFTIRTKDKVLFALPYWLLLTWMIYVWWLRITL